MDLQQFIGVLVTRWKFIVLTLLLGSFLTAGLVMTKTAEYTSTGRIFIAVPGSVGTDAFATLLVTQRAGSYASLATDPALLQRVVDRSGLPASRNELAGRISATVVPNTQIVEVTATGATPEEARDLADAEVQELVALVGELERPTGNRPAAVVARATGAPSLNPAPAGIPTIFLIAVGVALSVIAGVVGALVKDQLDLSVKSRPDVETATGAAVISALPLDRTVAKDEHSTVNPSSPLVEAFRVLRTNLRFADLDSTRQMILVTSALASEGKTLTSINLARAVAASGQSVLLIDGDLRSPNVAADLGLENAVGMLSVLLRRVTLADAIQYHDSGVHVLPTGPTPPNPAEVLETEAVSDLLADVRAEYDMIIIDAPPLLPVADTANLVRHVDGVLLLARFGRTRKDLLRLAAERITGMGGRIYGVVLNGIPRRTAGSYGYGYGYGYGETLDVAQLNGRRGRRAGVRVRES